MIDVLPDHEAWFLASLVPIQVGPVQRVEDSVARPVTCTTHLTGYTFYMVGYTLRMVPPDTSPVQHISLVTTFIWLVTPFVWFRQTRHLYNTSQWLQPSYGWLHPSYGSAKPVTCKTHLTCYILHMVTPQLLPVQNISLVTPESGYVRIVTRTTHLNGYILHMVGYTFHIVPSHPSPAQHTSLVTLLYSWLHHSYRSTRSVTCTKILQWLHILYGWLHHSYGSTRLVTCTTHLNGYIIHMVGYALHMVPPDPSPAQHTSMITLFIWLVTSFI